MSRDRLQRIVRQLDLAADPEFNPPLGEDDATLTGWIDEALSGLVAGVYDYLLIPNGVAGDEPLTALSSAEPDLPDDFVVNAVAAHLDASPEGRSLVIGLTFSSIDPEKAARIVNSVAKTYVQDRLAARQAATTRETMWLDKRLNELRLELQQTDRAVQEYRTNNNLVETGGSSLKEQELASVNSELTSARAELAAKQVKLNLVHQESSRLELDARGGRLEPDNEAAGGRD